MAAELGTLTPPRDMEVHKLFLLVKNFSVHLRKKCFLMQKNIFEVWQKLPVEPKYLFFAHSNSSQLSARNMDTQNTDYISQPLHT